MTPTPPFKNNSALNVTALFTGLMYHVKKSEEQNIRRKACVYFDNYSINKSWEFVFTLRLLMLKRYKYLYKWLDGVDIKFLIHGHTYLPADRGHATLNRLQTNCGVDLLTMAEYLEQMKKWDVGDIAIVDKVYTISDYKAVNEGTNAISGVKSAKIIRFDFAEHDINVSYTDTYDKTQQSFKKWIVLEEGYKRSIF